MLVNFFAAQFQPQTIWHCSSNFRRCFPTTVFDEPYERDTDSSDKRRLRTKCERLSTKSQRRKRCKSHTTRGAVLTVAGLRNRPWQGKRNKSKRLLRMSNPEKVKRNKTVSSKYWRIRSSNVNLFGYG